MSSPDFMPHQQKALDLTEGHNRVAYYLDMGLGKTFVGAEKMYLLNNDVNLIICQKSKIDDWVEHINTYYQDYSVFDLTKKNQAVRFREMIETDKFYDYDVQIVGVINYDLVFRRSYIAHIHGFTLLLDESSLIANENAKRSRFILKLEPESVILLSGTPTAGKYERLWSQCRLLGWKITKSRFYDHYVIQDWIIDNDSGFRIPVVVGYKNVDHLKRKLAEYGAVFMTTDEVMDLPEQQDITIKVPTTPEYRKFLKDCVIDIDTKNLVEFKDDSDFYGTDVTPHAELIGDTALTKRLYARQLCGQYNRAKLDAFRDLLESTSDRLIVFYNFNEELNRLNTIAKQFTRHISIVNGSVKDLAAYENYTDSITFVQYQAGAMGLNLQKANKIVYFTLTDKSELFEQSKKRIHRIGQNKTCFYYYLLCRNSIEIDILDTLKMRKDYTDALFERYDS